MPAFLSGNCPDKNAVLQFIHTPSSDSTERLPELLEMISAARNCSLRSDTVYGILLKKAAHGLSEQRDYSRSISFLNEATQVFRRSGAPPALIADYLSQCYYYLNFLYGDIGLRDKYIQSIDSCIANEKRVNGNYRYTLFFIEDKLKWYYTTGDYMLCLQYAELSESMIRRYAHGRDTLRLLMNVWFNKAQCLVRLGNLDAAQGILDDFVKPNVKSGRAINLGAMYGFYALVNKYRGNHLQEMRYDWRSYHYNKKIKYDKGCAESLVSIGRILFEHFHKTDSANICFKLALTYADRTDSVYIFNMLANLQVKKEDFNTAFQYFHKAFNCISPGMDENQLDSMTAYHTVNTHLNVYIIKLVTDKAAANLEAFKKRGTYGYLTRAIRISRQANIFLSRLKSDIFAVESNLSWRSKTTRLYENAIEACLLAKKFDEVFYFFEQSRSVLLDDKLDRYRGMTETDIVYQADMETRKNQLQRQLVFTRAGSAQAAELHQKIYELSLLQEQFIKKVAKPDASSTKSFTDLADFRARGMRHHQALIEYFVGDSAVYALTVKPDTVNLIRINKKQYDQLTLAYLSQIGKPTVYEKDFTALVEAGKNLYDLLFAIVPLPQGRILISPDGKYFPFEALVKSYTQGSPEYLIKDNSISYVYSARYLAASDAGLSGNSSLFMGMAPVSYDASMHLAKLAGSGQSLQRIAGKFDSKDYFITHKATRKNFLDHLGKFQLTHLYTHASANVSSGEPVLYFADSAIQLNNLVIHHRPSTLLIVLAACESGLGKTFAGEGVFSFNRAFASIGVPAALVNLWPVENKTTYKLNELFYGYVSKGLPFDVALQKAKIEYMRTAVGTDNTPYHWAAGIMTGRPSAVPGQRDFSIVILVAAGLFVFLVAAVMWGLNGRI